MILLSLCDAPQFLAILPVVKSPSSEINAATPALSRFVSAQRAVLRVWTVVMSVFSYLESVSYV